MLTRHGIGQRIIWTGHNSANENFFLWKVIHNAIFTKVKLLSRGIIVTIFCTFCLTEPENLEHLFFECPHIFPIWKENMTRAGRHDVNQRSIIEWELMHRHTAKKDNKARLLSFILKKFILIIWKIRNSRIFTPDSCIENSQLKKHVHQQIKNSIQLMNQVFDPGIWS